MGITFPLFDSSYISIKSLLLWLGHDVVLPPPITEKTMAIGTKHSPEFACLPLKITTGSFIEALDKGADSILMAGGVGPCRFGYYGYVQKEILESLGYKFETYIIEPPARDMVQALKTLKALKKRTSWKDMLYYMHLALVKQKYLDEFHKHVLKTAPYETGKMQSFNIKKKFMRAIEFLDDKKKMEDVYLHHLDLSGKLPKNPHKETLKVKIIGEIYLAVEPAANFYMEERLSQMGVEVTRTMYLGDWFGVHVIQDMKPFIKKNGYLDITKGYLGHMIGGHGLETVAHTLTAKEENYDGVIQVYPFTCAPEIMAQGILTKISSEKDIPVITFSLDQHSGEAGIQTRLEAFTDLLAQKKRQKEGKVVNV